MLTTVFLGAAALYLLLMAVLTLGVMLARTPPPSAPPPLRVSIIIPARNEERNIGRCLESLAALRYPPDLLEAVIVNDGSTDATARIVAEHARRIPWLRMITLSGAETALHGKVRALARGIEASHGDILMFTDADCTVPPGWVAATAARFADPSIGLVAGFTILRGTALRDRVQALDWVFLFSLAAGSLRLGFPVTAVGNNFSVRRDAYNSTGGYASIPFSVTEDLALFRALVAAGRHRALFPLDPETLVSSEPCPTAAALFRQKHRWYLGGRGMDGLSQVIVGLASLFHTALLFSPLLFPPEVWVPVLLVRCGAEALVLWPALRIFRRTDLVRALPFFFVYLTGTVAFFPPLVLFRRRVSWKGRTVGGPR